MIATIHALLDEVRVSWEKNILNKGIKSKKRVIGNKESSKKIIKGV